MPHRSQNSPGAGVVGVAPHVAVWTGPPARGININSLAVKALTFPLVALGLPRWRTGSAPSRPLSGCWPRAL